MSSNQPQSPAALARLIEGAARLNATEINVVDGATNGWTAHLSRIGTTVESIPVSAADAVELESTVGQQHQFEGVTARVRKMPKDAGDGPYCQGNRRLEVMLYPNQVADPILANCHVRYQVSQGN
jgi:hypothetical protein